MAATGELITSISRAYARAADGFVNQSEKVAGDAKDATPFTFGSDAARQIASEPVNPKPTTQALRLGAEALAASTTAARSSNQPPTEKSPSD
jgi:hypothetical protein